MKKIQPHQLLNLATVDIPSAGASSARSRSPLSVVENFIRSHLVGTIAVSVTVSSVLIGQSTWNVWTIYRDFKTAVANQFQLQSLSGEIVHLDEVLTMSARMAAATGDAKWEKRYRQYEPKLDQAIKQTIQIAPNVVQGQSAQTDAANIKLIEFENRAFTLVRQGKREEAFKLLLSQNYDTQKQIYSQGINSVITNIKTEVDSQLQSYSERLLWSIIFAGASFPILLASWLFVLSQVRIYIRERQQAQNALLDSQQSLLKVNQELEAKVEEVKERTSQLQQQEQATKQENEVLQTDVSHLLDIVSAVETGDLSVQAQVSDRATGLVADTLNRLIEELARIMAVVLSTAGQVTQGAEELEQLASSTAGQAQRQAQFVSKVQAQIVNFNDLSQETAQQALVSDESVQQAIEAVDRGQQEIATMTDEIEVLQQGTEQIVRRAEMLTNFVASAAQFAKDQKRVAALTRVLALNASMVAARASGQQDPEQFASIASEFEAIATQVNELAIQTNQSLLLLQQRTDQIQTVVSGINQDVNEISNSVNQFTLSVEQSRQVFDNIRSVTDRVAQLGQQVTKSSQAIANTARSTLHSIQEIATVAVQTESRSRFTREQASVMDRLAHTLLERVRFFRISTDAIEATSVTTLPVALKTENSDE